MYQSHSPTVAAWKWCAMGCLCSRVLAGTEHLLRWCLPCVPTGNPRAEPRGRSAVEDEAALSFFFLCSHSLMNKFREVTKRKNDFLMKVVLG